MLHEIISFGGYWKNFSAIVRQKRKEVKQVRLKAESEARTVLVQIKVKMRDTNETVKDESGKVVKNERYGKFYYQSFDSLELEQTTPEEVRGVVKEAILRASKK